MLGLQILPIRSPATKSIDKVRGKSKRVGVVVYMKTLGVVNACTRT